MGNFQDVEVISNDSLISRIRPEKFEPEYLISSIAELFKKDCNTNKKKFFVINCLNANLRFSRAQSKQFCEFLLTNKEYLKESKIAVLANDPLTTCFFLLIQDQLYLKIESELKVFITEIAALRWIGQ